MSKQKVKDPATRNADDALMAGPSSSSASTLAGAASSEVNSTEDLGINHQEELLADRATLSALPSLPITLCDSIFNVMLSRLSQMTWCLNEKILAVACTSELEKIKVRGLTMAFYRSSHDTLSNFADRLLMVLKDGLFNVNPNLQLPQFAEDDERWKAATEADVDRAEAANREKDALLAAKFAEYETVAREVEALEKKVKENRRLVEKFRKAAEMKELVHAVNQSLLMNPDP